LKPQKVVFSRENGLFALQGLSQTFAENDRFTHFYSGSTLNY
jgi:hypothetical protein